MIQDGVPGSGYARVAVADPAETQAVTYYMRSLYQGPRSAGKTEPRRLLPATWRECNDCVWIIGIITLILLLIMLWRGGPKRLRERFEQPKFQLPQKSRHCFAGGSTDKPQPDASQENNHANRNS